MHADNCIILPQIHLILTDKEMGGHISYRNKLSEAQRRRMDAMREKSRHNSYCAWLLVRVLACRWLGVENHALRFDTVENGKPYLPEHPGFHFSISHTRGAVAAVISEQPVGVDVERLRMIKHRIAKRFFTQVEQAYIEEVEDLRDQRFFEIWTRKEACIKQTGKGLATPLPSVETLSGSWARRLHTVIRNGYVLSCCCEERPDKLPLNTMSERQLFASAEQLSDCP